MQTRAIHASGHSTQSSRRWRSATRKRPTTPDFSKSNQTQEGPMVTTEQIKELRAVVKTNYDRYMSALDLVEELAALQLPGITTTPQTVEELAPLVGVRLPRG